MTGIPFNLSTIDTTELDTAVAAWLNQPADIVGSPTVGHWIVTDMDADCESDVTAAFTLGETFGLAAHGDRDDNYADPDEFLELFKLFTTPEVEDGEETGDEVLWGVHPDGDNIKVRAEYCGEDSPDPQVVFLPVFTPDTQALEAGFSGGPGAAVAALRVELVRLLLHVREHLNQIPVLVDA